LDLSRFVNIILSDSKIIDNLPINLETLILTCKYDSKLYNLPNKIKRLDIINLYDLETLNFLPNSLEELTIGLVSSNYDLDKSSGYFSNLPSTLKKLVIDGNTYNHIDVYDYKLDLSNLPAGITWLEIKNTLIDFPIFDILPNNLTTLIISSCFTNLVNWNVLDNLPNSLKNLFIKINKSLYCLNSNVKINLNNLPNSLSQIIVYNNFILDIYYPNVTSLILNLTHKDTKLPR
jgi:hypothetical protein